MNKVVKDDLITAREIVSLMNIIYSILKQMWLQRLSMQERF